MLYALEGFLARLTVSKHASHFVLKGGVLLSTFTARIGLHIDVNFGDPIWPAPASVELPLLLGGTLELRGYPDHMVLAEKIVTAIARGDQNTRWRDFVDITSACLDFGVHR